MNEWIRDVGEFHRVMELPTRERPTIPSDGEVRLRLKLKAEELFETLAACGEQPDDGDFGGSWQQHVESAKNEVMRLIGRMPVAVDLPAYVDGLVDLLYVTIGAALAFGVDLEPVWKLVQAANMAKTSPCDDETECDINGYCVRCKGRGRIVKRRPDGKVLKPEGWAPPDIAGELRRQSAVPPPPTEDATAKLERLRHAIRDAKTHGFDAGSCIRLVEAAK